MDTSLIIAAVVVLIFLGFILFKYFYTPDWMVSIAPAKEKPIPSATIVTPAIKEGLIEDVFNLKRTVKK